MIELCDYTKSLYDRYRRSGGKAYISVPFNLQRVREGALRLPEKGLTKFVNCARSKDLGIDYTNVDNVFQAYFGYMNDRWNMDTINLSWTGIDYV